MTHLSVPTYRTARMQQATAAHALVQLYGEHHPTPVNWDIRRTGALYGLHATSDPGEAEVIAAEYEDALEGATRSAAGGSLRVSGSWAGVHVEVSVVIWPSDGDGEEVAA